MAVLLLSIVVCETCAMRLAEQVDRRALRPLVAGLLIEPRSRHYLDLTHPGCPGTTAWRIRDDTQIAQPLDRMHRKGLE